MKAIQPYLRIRFVSIPYPVFVFVLPTCELFTMQHSTPGTRAGPLPWKWLSVACYSRKLLDYPTLRILLINPDRTPLGSYSASPPSPPNHSQSKSRPYVAPHLMRCTTYQSPAQFQAVSSLNGAMRGTLPLDSNSPKTRE